MLASPAGLHVHRAVCRNAKRALSDLIVPSSKPIISYGPPGRSAVTGHVATVFGCTGFLGRYVVAKLAKAGTQVVVPYREEDEKRHLKLMGDLGQVVPLEWDIRNEQQIEECVRHSDIVYNLVGRDFETKNFTYNAVHADGAERIAKICAKVGVPRLVHVSHLNASTSSPSKFYQSKAEGEARVRDVFPDATILRPAAMYGAEDKLLNNMAFWSIWWGLNQSRTKMRPVHALDVAQAAANLVRVPALPRTLALPGPTTMTVEYMLDLVTSVTFNKASGIVIPKPVALAVAKAAQAAWWPLISPDEVERRYIDDARTPGDWDVVGVTPDAIESWAVHYLRRYRTAENYGRAVVLPSTTGPDAQ